MLIAWAVPVGNEITESAVLILHIGEKAQQFGRRVARGLMQISAPDATVQPDGARGVVHACDSFNALLARLAQLVYDVNIDADWLRVDRDGGSFWTCAENRPRQSPELRELEWSHTPLVLAIAGTFARVESSAFRKIASVRWPTRGHAVSRP